MARMINPFRALGLDTQGLRGIAPEELRALAHSQWRAMQRIFHPDKGRKNDRRSKEINDAYEEICCMLTDGDERLQEFFGKDARRTAEEKRARQTAFLQSMYQGVAGALLEYLSAFGADPQERLTVFNCAPCVIRMADYALGRYKERQRQEIGLRGPLVDHEIFYTLRIDSSWAAVKERRLGVDGRGKQVTQAMPGRLVCGIDTDTIRRHESIASLFAAVGYCPTKAVRRERSRYFPPGGLPESDFSYAHIPLECVQRIMPLLTPYIESGTLLFSFQQGQQFFSLEGTVTKIEKI